MFFFGGGGLPTGIRIVKLKGLPWSPHSSYITDYAWYRRGFDMVETAFYNSENNFEGSSHLRCVLDCSTERKSSFMYFLLSKISRIIKGSPGSCYIF